MWRGEMEDEDDVGCVVDFVLILIFIRGGGLEGDMYQTL